MFDVLLSCAFSEQIAGRNSGRGTHVSRERDRVSRAFTKVRYATPSFFSGTMT